MEIVVCIKQVPQMTSINKAGGLGEYEYVLNHSCAHAIEAALQIGEKTHSAVTAISMGNEEGKSIVRYAFAMGAEKGILLSDTMFAGADTLATAYTLSMGIRKKQFSLVICGSKTSDGGTGQVGPSLAEQLNIPHASNVIEVLEITKAHIVCKRKAGTNYLQTIKMKLPALLVVEDEMNIPRMPTMEGMASAPEKNLEIIDYQTLQADEKRCGQTGSGTKVLKTFCPSYTRKIEYFNGSPEEIGTRLDIRIKKMMMEQSFND